MTERVLFARIGWMKRYKGKQADDERPIGGGKYNETGSGHELFNFLRLGGKVFGYFQPQMQPKNRRKAHPSSIHLEKIEPGFRGDVLNNVLVIFFARKPKGGGQYIVGWYRNATVYRHHHPSSAIERDGVGYFVQTKAGDEKLIPDGLRSQPVPGGKGGVGQANICYLYKDSHTPKSNSPWITKALEYVASYQREDAAKNPASETDNEISQTVSSTLERAAGYQSNPRIRRAVEDYAMNWALKRLRELGLSPVDTHTTKPYDFVCRSGEAELFVEVKGTQEDGRCISLTPNEVEHAKRYRNSALFIVYNVKIKGKRKPEASGGEELFLNLWDIKAGNLEPRGYSFRLPEAHFQRTQK
jgi:Domain of unknown function (DUF3883)